MPLGGVWGGRTPSGESGPCKKPVRRPRRSSQTTARPSTRCCSGAGSPRPPAPPAPLPALPEDRPVVDYDALLSRAGGPGEAPETGPPPLAAALVAGAGGAASSSAPAPPPDSGSGDEEPEDPGAEWWDKDEPTG